eukprot:jgi/Psemu1/285967/fgenesh1_pg.110_\
MANIADLDDYAEKDVVQETLESNSSSLDKGRASVLVGREGPRRVLITELNDHDVLQGRGSGSMQNAGNIRFRALVEELRPAYVATSSRKKKAKMISNMVRHIQSRKGRFLQRVSDNESGKPVTHFSNEEYQAEHEQYVEMTDEEAAEKTKQAIRYVHYKKVPLEEERRKKRAAGTFPSQDNANFFSTSMRDANEENTGEAAQRADCGENPKSTSVVPPTISHSSNVTNASSNVSIPGMNAVHSQLQNTDLGQFLATLQSTQTALAAQVTGSISSLSQVPVKQAPAQKAPVGAAIVPALGNLQQQSNPMQRIGSSAPLFPNKGNDLSHELAQASSLSLNNANIQNTTTSQQAESMLPNLVSQPPSTMSPVAIVTPQPSLEVANSLLTSFLANKMSGTSTIQQSTNPGTGVANQLVGRLLTDMTGQQQQHQGLRGENILQAMPGIGNANVILASNANATFGNGNNYQGQNVRNTAKRPRLSLDNIDDN